MDDFVRKVNACRKKRFPAEGEIVAGSRLGFQRRHITCTVPGGLALQCIAAQADTDFGQRTGDKAVS